MKNNDWVAHMPFRSDRTDTKIQRKEGLRTERHNCVEN